MTRKESIKKFHIIPQPVVNIGKSCCTKFTDRRNFDHPYCRDASRYGALWFFIMLTAFETRPEGGYAWKKRAELTQKDGKLICRIGDEYLRFTDPEDEQRSPEEYRNRYSIVTASDEILYAVTEKNGPEYEYMLDMLDLGA